MFKSSAKTFLLKVYQVCSKVVVELPQYCIVLMTAINCSVNIVYVYSGYSSSHNSPDIWCKISISSPGQQNYPKGSFRILSQRALFELFDEHIPISLIPFPSCVYLKSKDIFTEHKLCCSVGQKINMTKMMLVDWCWSFCWSYLSFHVDVPAVCLLRSSFFSTRIIWYKLILLIATNNS